MYAAMLPAHLFSQIWASLSRAPILWEPWGWGLVYARAPCNLLTHTGEEVSHEFTRTPELVHNVIGTDGFGVLFECWLLIPLLATLWHIILYLRGTIYYLSIYQD